MSQTNDLISRLEKCADNGPLWIPDADDFRAAAVAVQLVAECRKALAAIRNEVSAGCHPDAPVEELKTGIHYEPVLVVDTVIEKIAEWEGEHV